MALLDTQVGVLANQALNFLVGGKPPRRMGNAHPNLVPYQVFEAADGPIVIAVGNDRQHRDLCKILGLPGLAADPKYSTNAARVALRTEYVGLLAKAIVARGRIELAAALEAVGVPAGPINALDAVFNDPQVVARGMRIDKPHARAGSVPGVRSPVVIDGLEAAAERGAPMLGQHTHEVLMSLGLGEAEIDALRSGGAVS